MNIVQISDKVLDALNALMEYLMGILMLALVGITFSEVFRRYVLNDPTHWASELCRFILIWMTFTGACIVTRLITHLTMLASFARDYSYGIVVRGESGQREIRNDNYLDISWQLFDFVLGCRARITAAESHKTMGPEYIMSISAMLHFAATFELPFLDQFTEIFQLQMEQLGNAYLRFEEIYNSRRRGV